MAKKSPHTLALEFRGQLIAMDDKAAARIVDYYDPIKSHLIERLRELTTAIDMIDAGQTQIPIDERQKKRARLFAERVRTLKLAQQVQTELRIFSSKFSPELVSQQRQAMNLGADHAVKLMTAAGDQAQIGREFNYVPTPAIEVMVGYMGNGTPVNDFLSKQLGADIAARMRSELLIGVATGRSINETARAIVGSLDGNRTRAQTVARTETLRSYREASREEYLANGDVIDGWIWTAAKDGRCCAVCYAMDGKEFTSETPFASHTNCRCVARPKTKTFKELGFDIPETRPEVEDGETAFAKLPEKTQRRILGKGKFDAYKSGSMPLRNVVGYKANETWGPSRYERRLSEALKGADKNAFSSKRAKLGGGRANDVIAPPAITPDPVHEEIQPEETHRTGPLTFPIDPNKLSVVKRLGGSTGAELVKDSQGQLFVRKRGSSTSADHLREEALTDSLYRAAGVPVPDFRLYETDAGPVKLAQFIEGGKLMSEFSGPERQAIALKLGKHYAVDAFLANQDVTGLELDNILIDRDGVPWRIDNGSGLRFRAQGGRKAGPTEFTEHPLHFFSMRDKQYLAGKTFGHLDYYEASKSITQLLDNKDAMLQLVKNDPKMHTILEKRFAHMADLEEIGFQFENDRFKVDWPEDMARHMVTMRSQGMFDKLTNKLTNEGRSPQYLSDADGKSFDALRDAAVILKFYEYMNKHDSGLSYLINQWASGQGGSSWSGMSAAFKHVLMLQRNVPMSEYFDRHGQTLRSFEEMKATGATEARIRQAMIIQQAFTYHTLTTIDMPSSDREARSMKLVRTEYDYSVVKNTTASLKSLPASKRPIVVIKGALESHSAFRWVKVHNNQFTVQETPHHRIIASYLQNRGIDGQHKMFLGDGENEFLALSEGLELVKVAKRAPHNYNLKPEEMNYKASPHGNAGIRKLEKERWRTINRGGVPEPIQLPQAGPDEAPLKARKPPSAKSIAAAANKAQKKANEFGLLVEQAVLIEQQKSGVTGLSAGVAASEAKTKAIAQFLSNPPPKPPSQVLPYDKYDQKKYGNKFADEAQPVSDSPDWSKHAADVKKGQKAFTAMMQVKYEVVAMNQAALAIATGNPYVDPDRFTKASKAASAALRQAIFQDNVTDLETLRGLADSAFWQSWKGGGTF